MGTLITVFIVLIVLIGAAVLVVTGARRFKTPDSDPLEARLAEFSQRGEVVSLEEIEMSQPFVERVVYPLIRKIGEMSSRFTPQNVLEQTRTRLELAGNPGHMDASTFLSLHFVTAVLLGGVMGLVSLLAKSASTPEKFVLVMVFVVLGYFLPDLYVKSIIDRRQRSVRKAMPDALDLLTICVEAGLGFDAAMAKVNEKWDNELAIAFGRVIREIQLGKLRKDALKDMSERIGLAEMTSFVAAVIQSEMLGVSMAKVLRIQSDQMRMKRRQRAEEEAHKAPIKMIIPMGIFIFPSLMIVLLTPAGLRLWRSLRFFQ